MKKNIIISAVGLGLLVGFSLYLSGNFSISQNSQLNRQVASAPKNICSMTINSDDEIQVFRNKLLPDGRFKFTELVTQKDDWFESACQSNIQCDVLIISGHFAGSFIGKSGQRLDLSQLEAKSCSRQCAGIISQPKEVYLFGCNTLATKDPDNRTPEQYLQVLLEDGFDRIYAERIVEARYGPSGDEILNRTKRAFPGVPVIYGFCKKAPLGTESGPLLQKYLSTEASSYYDRLTSIEKIKNQSQPYSESAESLLQNNKLGQMYKDIGRCFRQTPGASLNDEMTRMICEVRNVNNPITLRAQRLDTLLKSDKSLSYIELCNEFFNEIKNKTLSPEDQAAVAQVKNNPKLKNDLFLLLDKFSFYMAYEYGVLAIQLGLEKQKVISPLSKAFVKMISKDMNNDSLRYLINSNHKNPFSDYMEINFEMVNSNAIWTNESSIEAIGLTGTKDTKILQNLRQILFTGTPYLKKSVVAALINLKGIDNNVKNKLVEMLYDSNSDIRANAVRALSQITIDKQQISNEIIALIGRETDNWVLKKATLFFTETDYDNPTIQTFLAKSLKHTYWEVPLYAAEALARRKITDPFVIGALRECLSNTNSSAQMMCRAALTNSGFKNP